MSTAILPIADTWSMHGDIGTGWWIVMVLGMVVFWGAVIVVGAWLLRGATERGPARGESPRDILERRFAEGAISADEYRERRDILGGSPDTANSDGVLVAAGTAGKEES